MIVEGIGQVEQLISSNKRINVDFHLHSGLIINFDLKIMNKNVIAYDSKRLCLCQGRSPVTGHRVILLYDMMHDSRLYLAGY